MTQPATEHSYFVEGYSDSAPVAYPTFYAPAFIEFYRPSRLNRLRRLIARWLNELAARIDA